MTSSSDPQQTLLDRVQAFPDVKEVTTGAPNAIDNVQNLQINILYLQIFYSIPCMLGPLRFSHMLVDQVTPLSVSRGFSAILPFNFSTHEFSKGFLSQDLKINGVNAT